MLNKHKNHELTLFIILNSILIIILFFNFFIIKNSIRDFTKTNIIQRAKALSRFVDDQEDMHSRFRSMMKPRKNGDDNIKIYPDGTEEYNKFYTHIKKYNKKEEFKLVNNNLLYTGLIKKNGTNYIIQSSLPYIPFKVRPTNILLTFIICNIIFYFIILYIRKILKSPMESIDEKEKLASSIAHEIKNPLSGISMFVELLERKIKSEPEIDYIINIKKQVKNLNKIVSNFINYARPFKINRQKTDILELFNTITQEVDYDLKNITIIKEAKENTIIEADPVLLRQILLNLILNSIDALEDVENKKISISIKNKVSGSRVIFSNNGTPIPLEEQKKIFEPYFTTKIKGSGLGLSICRKIMKEHGGDIILNKSDKESTEFILKFGGKI